MEIFSAFDTFFMKNYLPLFLLSFFTFAFLRAIFYALRLVNENAIGREFIESVDETDDEISKASKHGSLEFVEMEMAHRV